MRALSHLLPLVGLLSLGACQASPPQQNGAANDAAPEDITVVASTVPLRVTTTQGLKTLTVEVAITEQEQEQGLMHRATLRPGHGMLFPFTLPRMASFWMKDTPLPLDLLFITPDGTITAILRGKPDDLHPLSTNEPVSAVVEIGGGEAQRLGIAQGDHAEWGDCKEGRQRPGQPINPLAFCPTAP